MRAPGPPLRFLIAVIGLWVVGRTAFLLTGGDNAASACLGCRRTPEAISPGIQARADAKGHQPTAMPRQPRSLVLNSDFARRAGARWDRPVRTSVSRVSGGPVDQALRRDNGTAEGSAIPPVVVLALRAASAPAEPPAGLAAPVAPAIAAKPVWPAASVRRWSASAWLFVRGGGGSVALAGAGQLGGSQTGARLAYAIDDRGRVAAAARAYTPLRERRGAEGAVGIDLRPLPDIPFRLSVERRIAIGRDGRDAWSAYAAGGFFRALPGAIELDGYAQAGVVGARSRDLFADGAVRVARRVDVGDAALLAGAGAWGAAQPGAARLDAGPHLAVRVPAGGATLSAALDWRFRIAGDARPGSGAALTIVADF